MEKLKIALLYGGNSSEWEISVLSGKNVAAALNADKYAIYEILIRGIQWNVVAVNGMPMQVPINKDDFSAVVDGKTVHFDLALMMIHGTPGENGLLPAYLQMLHIPYTGCSSKVGCITFDKFACKSFLRQAGVKMAREVRLSRKQFLSEGISVDFLEQKLGPLPWFVKPNADGSSFGVSKIYKKEELYPSLEAAFKQDNEILIEEYIRGREVTNGVMKTATTSYTLPVTEIIPFSQHDFFNYAAKYNGESREVTPADLDPSVAAEIQTISSEIYDFLGCSGVVRMDYILRDQEIFFLEVNTTPGMTAMSLIPQMVRVAGYQMEEFIDDLIQDALSN